VVSHIGHLLTGSFDVGIEFQYVLDEATILLALTPKRDDVAAFAELGTCEIAVGERLFELFPRLNVVDRLPLLDRLGDSDQFTLQLLAGVPLDECADLLEEQPRVVRLVACRLARLDATQLAMDPESRSPTDDERRRIEQAFEPHQIEPDRIVLATRGELEAPVKVRGCPGSGG